MKPQEIDAQYEIRTTADQINRMLNISARLAMGMALTLAVNGMTFLILVYLIAKREGL